MSADFQSWTGSCQARIETFLESRLPAADCVPERLHKAMRYSVLGGGKRVRPLLSFAAGELALADAERRGKPTCHIEFDEATALLTGDSLQTLAFELLAEKCLADEPGTQLEMIAHLALAAGSRGMAGGQAFDLDSVGKTLSLPELEFMHIHKTGALIRAAVMLGARCNNRLDINQLSQLDHFAKCVGLAFQVVDDLLDTEATTATLGKTAGKDAENNKPTYVSILGISQARELAEKLQHDAYQALDSFGEAALRLRQVTDFIIKRKF
jgi:farnesyl diphosphate synthase